MNINLFLDDNRRPYDNEWVVAHNLMEALSFMRSTNTIEAISLDWHLGLYKPTGAEVLRKMLAHPLARSVFRNLEMAIVHTSSGSGRAELHKLLREAQDKRLILPKKCAIIDNPMAHRHPQTLRGAA